MTDIFDQMTYYRDSSAAHMAVHDFVATAARDYEGGSISVRDGIIHELGDLERALYEWKRHLGLPTCPIVIVLRDPDWSNDEKTFDGEVEYHDIDTGNGDLTDPSEFVEWASSHLRDAERMKATRPEAAAYITDVVMDTFNNLHWGPRISDYPGLDDADNADQLVAYLKANGPWED